MGFVNKVLKLIIGIFLILNILTFIFGYNILDNKIKENKNYILYKKKEYMREEEDVLKKLNILSNSKLDVSSNLKVMIKKINYLESELNQSLTQSKDIETSKIDLEDKLNYDKNRNNLLVKKKTLLEKKLQDKINQQIQAQKRVVVVRRTRSS